MRAAYDVLGRGVRRAATSSKPNAAAPSLENVDMVTSRAFAPLLFAGLLAGAFLAVTLAPSVARASDDDRVASIAAKGTISPVVPLEAGLGLGACAALFAFGLDRRARRVGR
jgi:hypothetical protein